MDDSGRRSDAHGPYDYDRTDVVDYETGRRPEAEPDPPSFDTAGSQEGGRSARSAAWLSGSLVFLVTAGVCAAVVAVVVANGETAAHRNALDACQELMVDGNGLPNGRFSTTDYIVAHNYTDGSYNVRGRFDTDRRTAAGRYEVAYVCDGMSRNGNGTWTANYIETAPSF